MGASRKLQGEIDRVLKKVQEGVDVFDSIWKKVYDTENVNQKEKFEADLKKEIKKLQRYRDQIKTWIQSNEIKDKKALMDARKLIEREMERFKICEKETKTKAFSKEGLEQQPKTDPKEKAKSETRDWLNTVVGDLESQIDTFEAELEGLTVKKGKTKPPRLTHLETSISRHKAHIMKLELILRLLDNDELSPEEVNDVKDFLDDYVERNQDDFDEFWDVDDLYSSLPLDKVECLEDLVTTAPPALVKGVGVTGTASSLKTSLISPPTHPVTVTSPVQQGASAREQAHESPLQDINSEVVPRTPPAKNVTVGSSAPSALGVQGVSATINVPTSNVVVALGTSATLSGVSSNPSVDEACAASSPSPVNPTLGVRDEEITSFSARKSTPTLAESGLRGVGRVPTNQTSTGNPLSSGIAMPISGGLVTVPSASEIGKRSISGTDERLGDSGMMQTLVSPRGNRTVLPQAAKNTDVTTDATGSGDGENVGEVVAMAGRAFSPSVGPGLQWRPGSPFQGQSDAGQFRGRTEITPDQREKFLQRFQQVQQGQGNPLGMASLGGGTHKPFSAQQNPLLQQFNSQSSSGLSHVGLGPGAQAPGFNTLGSSPQQANSMHQQQSARKALLSTGPKDAEVGRGKMEDILQLKNLSDDSFSESLPSSGLGKNIIKEDDFKANHPLESAAGISGSVTETVKLQMDTDLSPGQPLQSSQPSPRLGVIGRKSVSDLGTIGDNFGVASASSGEMHDQLHNLQMLEAAYHKLPQPKDSERTRSYTPRHPAATPPSYPQAQAPILSSAAFWERIGSDNNAIDTLFFAFYYQQNTYQQYLAAKELKKQSWRYHRKYNTWFQRHEEPKVTTDDYEQGTYVYFDFHITNDDMQHGWCQRIKTQFTFEYNYLEDELTE